MIIRMRLLALLAALAALSINPAQAQRTHAEHHRLQYLANRMLVDPAATVPELRANATPPARAMLAYLMATGVIPGGPDEARMMLDGAVWDAIAAVPPDGPIRSYDRPSRRRSQINAVAIWAQEDLGDPVATMLRRTLLVFRAYEAQPFVDGEGDYDDLFSNYESLERVQPGRYLMLTFPCRALAPNPNSAIRAFWPNPSNMTAYVVGRPFDCITITDAGSTALDAALSSLMSDREDSSRFYDAFACAFRDPADSDFRSNAVHHLSNVAEIARFLAVVFPSRIAANVSATTMTWDPLSLDSLVQRRDWIESYLVRTDAIARGRQTLPRLVEFFRSSGAGDDSVASARLLLSQYLPRPCDGADRGPMTLADRFALPPHLFSNSELIDLIPQLRASELDAAWAHLRDQVANAPRSQVRTAFLRAHPSFETFTEVQASRLASWSCDAPPRRVTIVEWMRRSEVTPEGRSEIWRALTRATGCRTPMTLMEMLDAGALNAVRNMTRSPDGATYPFVLLNMVAIRSVGFSAGEYGPTDEAPTDLRAWEQFLERFYPQVQRIHPLVVRPRYLSASWIGRNPAQAITTLRRASSPSAHAWLALVLVATQPQSDRRDREIRSLLGSLQVWLNATHELEPGPSEWRGAVSPPAPSDASAQSVSEYFAAYWLNADQGRGLMVIGNIPCSLIEARPELVQALSARFGSSMDSTVPRSTCEEPGVLPALPALDAFVTEVRRHAGDYYDGLGTIRGSYHIRARQAYLSVRFRPPTADDGRNISMDRFPLATWAELSRWNWQQFNVLRETFLRARTELARHYQARFRLAPQDAERAAHVGLCTMEYAGCSRPTMSLRRAILSNAPLDQVRGLIPERSAPPSGYSEQERDAFAFTNAPEPELMLAATRGDIVRLLLEHGHDPNAANSFGRTALMTMAQYNDIESARMLIAAGANVHAQTAFHRWDTHPFHGARTALMYAAANGSLAMIRLLLDAGADPMMTDSRGLRAAHYLNGEGPVPRNPRLSPAEFAEAMRLLD